nr:hypothetical protein [Tanacetum cinerariifolium]
MIALKDGIRESCGVPGLLLRVPGENNMYNLDLKNIVPCRDLTCLFAKVEAVNTACYVQNRVLVTKTQNKTPYELLHGRTPSIGFMRPFDCHVTILNTLDSLGKFDGKVDEGFLIRYSVSREENVQQYVLFLVWSYGSKNPHNTDRDAAFEVKEPKFKGRKPESEVHVSLSSSAQTKKHDDKTKREAKVKSPVELLTGYRNLSTKFEDYSDNNINEVNAADTSVLAVGQIFTNSTNTFSAAGPSNAVNTDGDVAFDEKEPKFDGRKPESEVNVSLSSSAQSKKHDDKTKREAKGKSPVESLTGYRNLSAEFEDFSDEVNAASTLVLAVRQISPNNTNTFSADGPLNTAACPTHGKYACIDTSQLPDDPDMPKLEKDITYFDDEDDVVKQKKDGIFISHDKHAAEILRKFRLTDGKSASTPIDTEKPLLKDPDGEDVDVHTYRLMIGSLMYLTSSRPDIMFAACACAHFQVTPKASHLHTCKKQTVVATSSTEAEYVAATSCCAQKPEGIFISQDKYVDEILRKFGLIDGKSASSPIDTEKPLLKDPDGGDVDVHTYRSMIGSLILISWQCKKKIVVATSSAEAEYVAAASCCAQVLWIQNQLLDYGLNVTAVNDVTRLQALVDSKKVIITKATIREALRLDDAESIDYLPNEEIFTELARMGYEKPSTKLTFYKAFFSSQWKFLIHTILQCMSAKRTAWNEFSSSMASAVICLSTSRKFNFSKVQVGDLSSHITKYSLPALTQKVFKNMRRVGKGCSGVETSLFEGMIVAQQVGEGAAEVNVDDVLAAGVANEDTANVNVDDVNVAVAKDVKDAEIKDDVLSIQDDESELAELKEVVELLTTAKLMTEVVTAAAATITATLTLTTAPSAARRRKGVVITYPEETATPSTIIHSKPKSKDKGKRIMEGERRQCCDEISSIEEEATNRSPRQKEHDDIVRNMVGFKMDYVRGMSNDDIHPIFEKKFNYNVAFLEKTKEQMEEEDIKVLKRKNFSEDFLLTTLGAMFEKPDVQAQI